MIIVKNILFWQYKFLYTLHVLYYCRLRPDQLNKAYCPLLKRKKKSAINDLFVFQTYTSFFVFITRLVISTLNLFSKQHPKELCIDCCRSRLSIKTFPRHLKKVLKNYTRCEQQPGRSWFTERYVIIFGKKIM